MTDAPEVDGRASRVFLVDDHAVFRSGVRAELAGQAGVEVVGEAGSSQVQATICASSSARVVTTTPSIVRRSPSTAVQVSLRGSVRPVPRALATASLAAHSRVSHASRSPGSRLPSASSSTVNATSTNDAGRAATTSRSMPGAVPAAPTSATARSSLCAIDTASAWPPGAMARGRPSGSLAISISTGYSLSLIHI